MKYSVPSSWRLLCLLSALLLCATVASAGTIASEEYDYWHKDLANQSQFQAVGLLEMGNSFCSGTVIGNRWVLTAAHCVAGQDDISFTVGGRTYEAKRWYTHKRYDRTVIGNGHDIALIYLDEPVRNVKAAKLAYFKGDPRGQNVTSVGFGTNGTGYTGNTGLPGEPNGKVKRAGNNVAEDIYAFQHRLGRRIMFYDNDAPAGSGIGDIEDVDDYPVTLEYAIAGGDSGGAVFDESGRVVGVHSYGFTLGGIFGFFRDFIPGYNGVSASTNVAVHRKWIQKVIRNSYATGDKDILASLAKKGNAINPLPDLLLGTQTLSDGSVITNAMGTLTIPEPTTAVLLLTGGTLLTLRRRRA